MNEIGNTFSTKLSKRLMISCNLNTMYNAVPMA